MIWKLGPWHWLAISFHLAVIILVLWFALAYGGLPRLWSHHEHKLIKQRDQIVSYTPQDIPADPINLRVIADEGTLACALRRAGWSRADNVSLRSGIKIVASVVLHRPYPDAPVSNLYVRDAVQDVAFERADGRSADKRHHVRFWRIGSTNWLGAATFDRGVGLSLFTLQVTHHIGPNVDSERDTVGHIFEAIGGQGRGSEPSRLLPGQWHRNGGGDKYRSDWMIKVYILAPGSCV